MPNQPSVILDGRGYALVPLADLAEATSLHAQGVTVRLEVLSGDSAHIDRTENLRDLYPKYVQLWGCHPRLYAVFNASAICPL